MKEYITLSKEKKGTPITLYIESEYAANLFTQWLKNTAFFRLFKLKKASKKQYGYLEGAVVPAWGKFQYNIDPRVKDPDDLARTLFKQDFNCKIVKDRNGNPRKVAKSLKGRQLEALNRYTENAVEHGYPVPNPDLYKLWEGKYSSDARWENYWDWLDFLEIDCDAMPSSNLLERKLGKETKIEYPKNTGGKVAF